MYNELFAERCYLRHAIALRPGDTVVDVGANIGLFALLVRLEVPDARILAIEPAPAAFARLAANAALHGDGWSALQTAVAAEVGSGWLTVYRDHSLLSTLQPDIAADRKLLCQMIGHSQGPLDDRARADIEHAIDEQLQAT